MKSVDHGHPLRQIKVSLALTLLAVIAGACGSAAPSSDSAPKQKVTFATLPALLINLPLWVAQDKGFFAEEGVVANVLPISGGGAQLLAALAGGSADATYATVQQIALANEGGQPLRMFVGNHTALPYSLLVQNGLAKPTADAGFPQAMQDLKGRRIAITTLGSDSHLKLLAMLDAAGMAPGDVTILQGGTTPVPAFTTGQYDAIFTIEPIISQLTVGLSAARNVLDLRKPNVGPESLRGTIYNGYVALPDVAKSPKMLGAARAIKKAIEFMHDPKNLPYLEKLAGSELKEPNEAVLREQLKNSVDGFTAEVPKAAVMKSLQAFTLKAPQTYEEICVGVAAGVK